MYHLVAGKLPIGRCEMLDGEGVVTHFVFLGPLLVPLDSVYALDVWRARRAFQVRRNTKSIALAYLRWMVAPLVLMITFIAFAGNQEGPPELGFAAKVTLGVMGASWLALVSLAGRSYGASARQRRVLASFVGHAAPPELVFDGLSSMVIDDLEPTWSALAGREQSYRADGVASASWRDLYPKDVPTEALPLYYTLCRYEAARSGEHVMANRARLAWARVEQHWAELDPSIVRRSARPIGLEEDNLA